jgi:hypothetical protein
MSTLKVTNIQATGETVNRAVSGVAAAWVDFDGITNVIQDSNNIASLTDQGTGQYQLAFSNNMSTQYFSISTNTGNRDSSNAGIQRSSQGGTSSSSNFHFENMSDSSNTNEDAAAGQGIIHGDLA